MRPILRNPWVRLGLAVVAVVAVVWGLLALSGVLTPFAVAFVVAYLLNPGVNALERAFSRLLGRRPWLARRLDARTLAVASLVIVVVFGVAAALLLIVPIVVGQVRETATKVPDYVQVLRARIDPLVARLNLEYPQHIEALRREAEQALREHWGDLFAPLRQMVGAALSGVVGFVLALLNIVLVPVVVVYLLFDMNHIRAGLADLVPPGYRPYVYGRFGEIERLLSAFIRGQLTVALLLGAFYAVGLSLCGVPMGFPVGFMIGLFNMIPYMSSVLGLPIAVGLSWVDDQSPQLLLAVVAVIVIGQFVEGNFITPRVVGRTVGLHAVVIMLAVLVFGTLFGFVGMVVAVPATAALAVFVDDIKALYLRSEFYRGGTGDPGSGGSGP